MHTKRIYDAEEFQVGLGEEGICCRLGGRIFFLFHSKPDLGTPSSQAASTSTREAV